MCSGRQERGGGEVGYSGGVQEALLVKKKNAGGERKRGERDGREGDVEAGLLEKTAAELPGKMR